MRIHTDQEQGLIVLSYQQADRFAAVMVRLHEKSRTPEKIPVSGIFESPLQGEVVLDSLVDDVPHGWLAGNHAVIISNVNDQCE